MSRETRQELAAKYRFHLGALLVLAGLAATFGVLTITNFATAHTMPFDIYLVLCAILIVAGGAFYQVHLYNRQQAQILATQRRENAVMREALDAHSIVSVTDAGGRICEANDRFLETFGCTREEAIGRSPRFIHDAADGPHFYLAIRQKLLRGETWEGEHSSLTKSGERRWFKATVVPLADRNGDLLKAISIRTDVTDQRAAEADRQVRALLDNLQDEVFIYRVSDLSICYMNNAACDRFGWDAETCRSRSISDLGPDFDEERFRRHVAPLVAGKVNTTYIQGQSPDGPLEISTSLFEEADGELVFISIVRDIAERQALARAKLSSVSVVSHELRTPLTSIAGALKMLQGKFQSDLSPQAVGILDIATRNTERLLFIVNDILDLEKIEAGKMNFTKEHLDLESLVSEAVMSHEPYASGRNVRLGYEAECRGAMVEADPARLMQVMSNLLSNAAKYSEEGDVVTVRISEQDTAWRVSVRDQGPGMSAEAQKKLFETFSQIAPADGKKRLGTGLGLAITRRILDHHAARIHVESEVGQGSTFYFDIPKAVAAVESLDDNAAA